MDRAANTRLHMTEGPEEHLTMEQLQAVLAPHTRRKDRRVTCYYPARIEILHPGPVQSCTGTVLDVSKSGLRVRMPLYADKNYQLKLSMSCAVAFGDVRHCKKVGPG